MPLEQVIKVTSTTPARIGIFNQAAQTWSHKFYWKSMRPNGGGAPSGRLKEKIDSDLGGLDKFKQTFAAAAAGQFGSGWAWLIVDGGALKIVSTSNAATPMAEGKTCLLAIDVFEHAYYVDYQNRRADYIAAWLDQLVNWDFAAEQLIKST